MAGVPVDLQHEVLTALWELGRSTVRDVHARVGEPRGLAYTTIATVMERLCAKGLATRAREGRLLVYAPAGTREDVERERIGNALARLLGPSPESAVAALVDALEEIDPALLDELDRVVAARRRGRRGP
jgi:predicted transcriptional regulator